MILYALFVKEPKTGIEIFAQASPEIHSLIALRNKNLEFNKDLQYRIYTYG